MTSQTNCPQCHRHGGKRKTPDNVYTCPVHGEYAAGGVYKSDSRWFNLPPVSGSSNPLYPSEQTNPAEEVRLRKEVAALNRLCEKHQELNHELRTEIRRNRRTYEQELERIAKMDAVAHETLQSHKLAAARDKATIEQLQKDNDRLGRLLAKAHSVMVTVLAQIDPIERICRNIYEELHGKQDDENIKYDDAVITQHPS